ncbi:hypothetical protein V7S43_014996 [Phytophthora oleae]|uniref:Uncharacterized protein n=1 Tax=Phytophthora oleae TaxID=2107226 RepID=A0ABD3F199_9STRA
MMPSLRRSRSASMSSLAQVDLNTLDPDVVLDYARKVMNLQPQPAISAEKLQMLFALSQKLMKWFLEDREQLQKQLKLPENTDSPLSPLHIQQVAPLTLEVHRSKESEKPSVASRILASVAPDIELTHTPEQAKDLIVHAQSLPMRPAEVSIMSTHPDRTPEQALQTVTENESLVPTTVSASATSLPQEAMPSNPPKTDALQVYMQVQSSVICMQKYVRGFMARRRFFKTLEELLRGRA